MVRPRVLDAVDSGSILSCVYPYSHTYTPPPPPPVPFIAYYCTTSLSDRSKPVSILCSVLAAFALMFYWEKKKVAMKVQPEGVVGGKYVSLCLSLSDLFFSFDN